MTTWKDRKRESETYLGVHELLREIARLSHTVRPDQRLANHKDLIRIRELPELGQGAHEPRVVVPPSSGVDEDDIVQHLCALSLVLRERHSVPCDSCRVLAVPLFEDLDFAYSLAT